MPNSTFSMFKITWGNSVRIYLRWVHFRNNYNNSAKTVEYGIVVPVLEIPRSAIVKL